MRAYFYEKQAGTTSDDKPIMVDARIVNRRVDHVQRVSVISDGFRVESREDDQHLLGMTKKQLIADGFKLRAVYDYRRNQWV